MKVRLPNGGTAQILWGVFNRTTGQQVVRWDARRDKVMSTARRLMREQKDIELQLRGQRFVTPPPEITLAPDVTVAPCGPASAPALGMPAAADPRPDVPGGLQTKAGTPERAVGAEAPAAISSP